jgi:tricorn protease
VKAVLFVCAAALAAPELFSAPKALLQRPAMSRTQIVFSYAGDLWTVPRNGGKAARLTTGVGVETDPSFSPDGSTVAFTGEYDGNVDVFIVPAQGGVPKRLTHHPALDRVVGWTPDGKSIVFRSTRQSIGRDCQLFTVSTEGGLPAALPFPLAAAGAFSPDGKRFVYAPVDSRATAPFDYYVAWKRYRGGLASYLWIANMADLSIEKIPREASNDTYPMWIGDRIYFLSDRSGPVRLYRYDPKTRAVTQLAADSGFDIRSASAGPDGIVYDQFGEMYVYDLESGKARKVEIEIEGDLPEVRPHFQDVSREIRNARISPTGVRALMEAHGEILTVPAEKGDIRNLTNTPGVMERDPAWSPDGQSVAYFSDESGEYALHIEGQNGAGTVTKIPLAGGSAFYFDPKWSPDSKHIAFNDNKLNLWRVDVAAAKVVKVDEDHLYELDRDIAWSPDSRWIAFVKGLPNNLHAVFVYSLETGKSTQITDGMSDARFPVFDKNGQYLYFTASTNYGPTSSGLDMTTDQYIVTRHVYAFALRKDLPSPVAPESDEEKPKSEEKPKDAAKPDEKPKPVQIDLDQIERRIVALPIPARNYDALAAGKSGVLFLLEPPPPGQPAGSRILHKFELKTRKTDKFAENIAGFDVSSDGDKILLAIRPPSPPDSPAPASPGQRPPMQYAIASTSAPYKAGAGMLKLTGMEVRVDPRAEWKQMYHEVWRIERSYFYDPNLHGVNAADEEKRFEPYLDAMAARSDLNYVFEEMLGEFTVGHLRGGGGSMPNPKRVPGGLLGADYEIANGHYRFKRVYTGEAWNPELRAPLAQPGVNIQDGEYLFEINGQPLAPSDDVSRMLENTAGKTVVLKVGPDPSGANAREVTVTPIASETALRNLAWVEGNRRKVDALSGGKLAYVYMPNTGIAGLVSFNRYFFSQTDKQGLVLDERFNGGGQAADYVVDVLRRTLLSYWIPRYGAIYRTPYGAIFGPKVMIVNEFAGSGGDLMPWFFREAKLGTLVGKRTWGGLVGVSEYPALMDGGFVTAPNFAFFTPDGRWDVENKGVTPDVEVELDPKAVREGRDPQLERAVAIALEALRKSPPTTAKPPAYPNYHRTTTSSKPKQPATAGQ